MAKDRKDGTNVHNWHWVEKDALPWCKKRLSELLEELQLSAAAANSPEIHILKVTSVEGDAVINNRKNKIIVGYELHVKASWEGQLPGDGARGKGGIEFPYISEENHDEDPEVLVSTSGTGAAEAKLKQELLSRKQVLFDKIAIFVKELRAGGPACQEPAASAPAAEVARPVSKAAEAMSAVPKAAAVEKPSVASSSGRHDITLQEQFYARPADLFDCFTNPQRIMGYTQSPAQVEPKVGGRFSIFGGSVLATFTKLEPAQTICLDWRFTSWHEKDMSKVTINLEEPQPGTTVLKLEHTGIPEEDQFGNSGTVEQARSGWQQQIFYRIRAVFGYGL
ncbi:hypothetical protein WJX74_007697 [Apatococcus lobatus]|uniref:Activator of Hsp90 ATPase AHSA1-like N-terminal domain-containing protein n=2 Tax=Apatococcus TaxID=904362 RepID=A0AAW1T2J2_9CHLO